MDKIWQSGAAVAAPPAPAGYGNGYPTGGDVGTSTPPTNPGAWWFHMMTMEVLNVVVAAGITPNGAAVNQLLAALDARYSQLSGDVRLADFTGGNQSLAATGHQSLPGGLKLKWGTTAIGNLPAPPAWQTVSVVFATAFPARCVGFMPFLVDANGTTVVVGQMGSALSTTGASVKLGEADAATQDITMYWCAIGY